MLLMAESILKLVNLNLTGIDGHHSAVFEGEVPLLVEDYEILQKNDRQLL